jgi:hypothetical protein
MLIAIILPGVKIIGAKVEIPGYGMDMGSF